MCYFNGQTPTKHNCDLFWRNREQVASDKRLILQLVQIKIAKYYGQ